MPVSKTKTISPTIRKKITAKQRKEAPDSWFLGPNKSFPYIVGGKIQCALLKAAITRAAQFKKVGIEAKARILYEQHCKQEAQK